jgi:hypothetical protein
MLAKSITMLACCGKTILLPNGHAEQTHISTKKIKAPTSGPTGSFLRENLSLYEDLVYSQHKN